MSLQGHTALSFHCSLIWIQSSILHLFHRFTAHLQTHLDCGTADMLHAREGNVSSCYPVLWVLTSVDHVCMLSSYQHNSTMPKVKPRVMEVVALQSCILVRCTRTFTMIHTYTVHGHLIFERSFSPGWWHCFHFFLPDKGSDLPTSMTVTMSTFLSMSMTITTTATLSFQIMVLTS